MLQFKWTLVHITTNKQANDAMQLVDEIAPTVAAFDTETTGLHIIADTPFLYQFGFLDPENMCGYAFAVDLEKQPELARAVIKAWHKKVSKFKVYLGHNIKFDLHMLINIGLPYTTENVSDTMFYIRFACDARRPAEGGPPLGLKEFASQYVSSDAKTHEKLLDKEKTSIVKELHIKLKQRLAGLKPPPEYNAKSYTLSVIEDMFKDPIIDADDLIPEVHDAYIAWLNEDVPIWLRKKITSTVSPEMIPYNKLNRKNLIHYALYDIVWTLEIYWICKAAIDARDNWVGLHIEDQLIYPLIEMERTGFRTDKEYLLSCKKAIKNYIISRRNELYNLTGRIFSIGQHALIKQILNNDFGLEIASTEDGVLKQVTAGLKRTDPDNVVIQVIELIQELRTLEKWYSTYVLRFEKMLLQTDRLYTTINQVGAVSGRVTCDFQQFPKDPITTVTKEELFHPRKLILCDENKVTVFMDYSQIELRFQAFYTILVGHPDLNLCRAYMPYKCWNPTYGDFDPYNKRHIKLWNEPWYYQEDTTKQWVPTDVHGATTEAAFDIKPEDDPDKFHKLRYIGKRVNFAKNYGATLKKIIEMFPEYPIEQCQRIDSAYYKAFPGVKQYHAYCYARAENFTYTQNMFGVKYYGVSGHKLINMLVQGTAAYYLKKKIIELYQYSKAHNTNTRWQMQIHDELFWISEPDNEHWKAFKHIMEDFPDTLVPIVSEVEVTETCWADKKAVAI